MKYDVLVVEAESAWSVVAFCRTKRGLNTNLIKRNNMIGAHTNTRIDLPPDFGLTGIIKKIGLKTDTLVYTSKWYSLFELFTSHSNIKIGRAT